MIQPVIKDVLIKYDNVYLRLVGEIDLPKELNECKNKIIVHPFMDYKKLPELISKMNINLAPLTNLFLMKLNQKINGLKHL